MLKFCVSSVYLYVMFIPCIFSEHLPAILTHKLKMSFSVTGSNTSALKPRCQKLNFSSWICPIFTYKTKFMHMWSENSAYLLWHWHKTSELIVEAILKFYSHSTACKQDCHATKWFITVSAVANAARDFCTDGRRCAVTRRLGSLGIWRRKGFAARWHYYTTFGRVEHYLSSR